MELLVFEEELFEQVILEIKWFRASSTPSAREFDNCAVACARPKKPTESKDECSPKFPGEQIAKGFCSRVN